MKVEKLVPAPPLVLMAHWFEVIDIRMSIDPKARKNNDVFLPSVFLATEDKIELQEAA